MTTSAISIPPEPAAMSRSAAIGRALLFLLACAPAFAGLPIGHPVANAAFTLGVTLLFLRWDRRSPALLGLELTWRPLRGLVTGFGVGILVIAAIGLGMWLVLPFPWAFNPAFAPAASAVSLVWFLCGNASEEIIFRGYAFERLIAAIGHWKAQIVIALTFALFHLLQGWPWHVALMGTMAGSLLFAMVLIRWQSLPAAIGVHAGANWVKELLLSDPPTVRTLFAPLSPRPWTTVEQWLSLVIFDGVVLVACYLLWRSIRRRGSPLIGMPAHPAVQES